MVAILPIILAPINALLVLKKIRSGLILYFVLALVSPHAHVAGYIIPYEIFAFPVVLVAVLKAGNLIAFRRLHFMLAAYVGLLVVSSLVAVLTLGASMEWLRLIATLRFLALVIIADSFLDRSDIRRVLGVALAVNLLAVAAQMLLPSSIDLFHRLYSKESQVVLARYAQLGYIPRAVGTFGSPVNLAAFCLVSFVVFYSTFLKGDRRLSVVGGALASVVVGIMSLTKLFVLGLPAILVATVLFDFTFKKRRVFQLRPTRLLFGAGFTVVAAWLGTLVVQLLDARGYTIFKYLEYLSSPAAAFETRYGERVGILRDTMELIRQHLVIGLGNTRFGTEFLGDSAFVIVLHDVGIVGAVLFAAIVGFVIAGTVRRRDASGLALFVCLLMAGFALPLFFNLVGALVWSYVTMASRNAQLGQG